MGKSLLILLFVICIIFSSCEKDEIQQNYQYQVIGETITLTDQQWNELWKRDIANLTLYKIESNGAKTIYQLNRDYVVQGNKIKRTPDSQIANFVSHNVVYDEKGKFKWSSEPNRNPELTLPYQIYADYNYRDSSVYFQTSTKISQLLKDKIAQKKSLKIVTVGTSISFGSHTYERYFHDNDSQTYHQLISKALLSYYGIVCKAINSSTDGGGVNQIQDLTEILAKKPDVAFLELGMNDHLGLNPDIDYYKKSLEQAIVELKENEIDVVLIGFFQQIENWELEYPVNTVLYNTLLSDLSQKYTIYFADIYSAFEKIDKKKLYKDYTGDFMHHPTSFANQLYYLEIMPFFIDKSMTKDELLQYLY